MADWILAITTLVSFIGGGTWALLQFYFGLKQKLEKTKEDAEHKSFQVLEEITKELKSDYDKMYKDIGDVKITSQALLIKVDNLERLFETCLFKKKDSRVLNSSVNKLSKERN